MAVTEKESWRDRMRAFLLMHPKTSALIMVAFGVAIVALDLDRFRSTDSAQRGAWQLPLGAGVIIGAFAVAVLTALAVAMRDAGYVLPRWVQVVGAFLVVSLFGYTHPRGDDPIYGGGYLSAVAAVDTCFVLALCYGAIRRWTVPVPDFDHDATASPVRHGRRWRRRSAARRPGRPGGR